MLRRTFARLDVTSRSLYAVIEPDSCFVGTLFELAMAARSRLHAGHSGRRRPRQHHRCRQNEFRPAAHGQPPLAFSRALLPGRNAILRLLREHVGQNFPCNKQSKPAWSPPLPMIWIGRTNCASPSNRAPHFRPTPSPASKPICASVLPETMETRVFGRLSAWQNWIFIRPNAVGASGALKVYGTGSPVKFNFEKV